MKFKKIIIFKEHWTTIQTSEIRPELAKTPLRGTVLPPSPTNLHG